MNEFGGLGNARDSSRSFDAGVNGIWGYDVSALPPEWLLCDVTKE